MRAITQPQLPNWEPFVFFKDEFTPSECETILHLAKGIRPEPAKVGGVPGGSEVPEIRSSELRWMYENENTKWLFDRLESVCAKVKESWYPFSLSGFQEPIQITHYKADKNGHYDWHQDFGAHAMSSRKLSFVILLNDQNEFEGGALELMGIAGKDKSVKQIAQGTVIAFPSWEFHRVLELTKGERWSLVCWVHGPPYV